MNGQVRKRASSDIEISQSEPSYASGVRSDLLNNAVVTWLTFLQMEQYAEEFIDNGYDDLETVKKIGPEDLEAIGVTSTHHKSFLLDAVRVLRHQGATWVYLIRDKNRDSGLIPTDPEYDSCGERASGGSSGIASGNSSSIPWNDQDFGSGENTSSSSSTSSKPKVSTVSNGRIRPSPVSRTRCQVELEQQNQNTGSPSSTRSRSLLEMTPDHLRVVPGKSLNGLARVNHIHEEEDLIQRVSDLSVGSKDPRRLGPSSPGNLAGLKLMLKERLKQESIQLCAPPFTSKNGDEYLSSLALRYSQELGYPQSEIQSSLEEIRFSDWTNQAQLTSYQHTYANVIRDELQRSFQPGIYASSSCISDQEGEALYDFANKYQGRSTLSSSKSKLSPSGFYDLAKKVICRRNQSASAFSTPIKFNRKQNALNDMDQRFMTRTRLRKGGPPTHTPSLQRPVYGGSQEVQSIYGTPLLTLGRRDPPAGLDMSTFRSVNGRGGNRYPGSDLYFGTNGGPSTPLVMHKTSPNGSIPPNGRVQMFRTRVVYNETRDDVLHSKSQEASV